MKKFICFIILIVGCKDAYNPTLKDDGYNYLVVEGNIVMGDSTFIHLTRTVAVSATSIIRGESTATVNVESDDGETYPLQNLYNGFYYGPPLSISSAKKYRLHIFTADGKEYASEFVPVKLTPLIDSVSWAFNDNDGVNIYVNTHDATRNTTYYRWKYVAAWEHRSKDSSEIIYENGAIRYRLPSEQIYRCWTIDSSSEIFITSTAPLSSDIVFEKPLVTIPYKSEQLSQVYSILVTQYALTKEGFEYWQNLKKNTEQLGSIFDPQPFAEFGNMHCLTDATEPVVGFITACSTQQQRIYIYKSQIGWLPDWPFCKDTIIQDVNAFSYSEFMPVYPIPFVGIAANLPACVDCRLQGGSTNKPDYMP